MKNAMIVLISLSAIGCGGGLNSPEAPDYLNKLSSGVWGSSCSVDSRGISVKETFTLSKNLDVNRSTTYYSDKDCLFPEYTVSESGTASLSYPKWGLVFIKVMVSYTNNVYKFYEIDGEEFYETVACSDRSLVESNLALYDLTESDLAKLSCENDHLAIQQQSSMEQVSYIGGDGKEGQLLDYKFNKVEVFVQSEAAAVSLRQSPVDCGLSNVDIGDNVTVTGNCQIPDKSIYSSSAGKLGFDVVRISGDTVFFGDDTLAGEALFNERYAPFGPRSGGRRGKYENQVENDRALAFDTQKGFRII